MSVLNENFNIRLKTVNYMCWDKSVVEVAPRPYHALVFRVKGSAEFLHGKTRLTTSENDVFYMPSNYTYKAIYSERNEIIVLHFESDYAGEMEKFPLGNPHIVGSFFNKLYDIWKKKEKGYYFAALSVVGALFENILNQQEYTLNSETVRAFESAVEYMNKNYTSRDFTVDGMVKKAHMSNTYFRKMFLEKFGTTPVKHLSHLRLSYAEKLLVEGKYPIKDVAEMSGFSDEKYFSRLAKKEFGVSPSKLYKHKKGM